MMARRIAVGVGLLAAWAGSLGSFPQPRPTRVTVHAAVERAESRIGPLQVVPWKLVRDLGPQDFEIVTDAGPRAIESWSIDDAPVTIVVLLDVSASTEVRVDWLLEPLRRFLIPALKPGDRLSFGRFGALGLHVDGRFAADRQQLLDAARDLLRVRRDRTAPAPQSSAATLLAPPPVTITPLRPDPVIQAEGTNGAFGLGASPVWDAVDAALAALESQPGRRAIIMVTDGRSTGNVHSLDDVILRAVAADVPVFIVGEAEETLIQQGETGWARVNPAAFLRSMADVTGGAYADMFGREEGRPRKYDQVDVERWMGRMLVQYVGDLDKTYALSFVPAVLDGQLHRLEVRVRKPDLKVRARHGYVAPSGER